MKNALYCLLITGILYGCGDQSDSKSSTGKKIERAGVAIDYIDTGAGDTTLVFIHGWGINKEYWQNQVAHFSKRYRVVTLDLPGFGKSGKNRNNWTIKEYGEDLTALIATLDLNNVVVIGHSMSGSVAVETALMNPKRVIGVVGVDNMREVGLVLTPELEQQWDSLYNGIRANFKPMVTKFMLPYLYSSTTDSTVKNRVNRDMLSSDTTLAVDVLASADKYPFAEKLRQLNKTVYLLNSDYIPTDSMVFQKQGIEVMIASVGNTGHYPMIENPLLFNEKLTEILEQINGRPSSYSRH